MPDFLQFTSTISCIFIIATSSGKSTRLFVEKPVSYSILGHVDQYGQVIRYDTVTNDFAKGHPDRGLNTFYKPDDGQKYYDGERKRDLEHGGTL